MDALIARIFFQNWQRKLIAVIAAIVVWLYVNQSITEQKIVANVPVRVINIPKDKTIIGLLPNGYLSHRVTLTLSGTRDVISDLEPGDFEVLLDASTADSDDWVVQITKKNLVSLNPSFDLRHYINSVSHPDFVIKMSKLVTEKVPIEVKTPIGKAPEGYEYLDIWPKQLMQTISGPKEEIQNLKVKGLKLVIDLDKISNEELNALKQSKKKGHDDEISFPVPEKWKMVLIPFRHNFPQEINDPDTKNLRLDFLRKQVLPIGKDIPITVFYPSKNLDKINPDTLSLAESEHVRIRQRVAFFTQPLYVKDVSRLFLNIIRDNIEIVLVAAPTSEREALQWNLEVIDPKELEDTYVAYVNAEQKDLGTQLGDAKKGEEIVRKRFRSYMQKLNLYTSHGEKLQLNSTIEGDKIVVSGG